MPAGHPSMIHPTDAPCDSPKVVTRNIDPNEDIVARYNMLLKSSVIELTRMDLGSHIVAAHIFWYVIDISRLRLLADDKLIPSVCTRI